MKSGRSRQSATPALLRSRRRKSRGQTLVEFALVFPVFILLLAGMIDFGFGFYSYMTMINGARIGARFGTVSPTFTSGITNAVLTSGVSSTATVSILCWSSTASGHTALPVEPPSTANGWVACNPGYTATAGDTISVTVNDTYHMIMPLTFGNSIPLSSNIQMAIE